MRNEASGGSSMQFTDEPFAPVTRMAFGADWKLSLDEKIVEAVTQRVGFLNCELKKLKTL